MAAAVTMIRPDEALRLVLEQVHPGAPRAVCLADACGLQLAASVVADRDYPPFDRAVMDGYAVCLADAGKVVNVLGEVAAGQMVSLRVKPGQCLEIMTGAACPPGTEAVVPKEEARRKGDRLALPPLLSARQHIAAQGSECRQAQVVLTPAKAITPLAIAVMASFGMQGVQVIPRPSIGIVTTGEELVDHSRSPGPGQIRNSNGPMLAAMVRSVGLEATLPLHAPDQVTAIVAALEQHAARDLVVLTGGVSAGKYDLVPESLKRIGAELIFHRVSQKPGKPLLFARKGRQWMFGLPGNPLAVHFCFHRYVSAAIRRIAGQPAAAGDSQGTLAAPAHPKGSRTYFALGQAGPDQAQGPGWTLHPLPSLSSADIFGPCEANCYIEVPPGETEIPAGEKLPFSWLR